MCLVVVVWRAHPQYPCLIAANRDEFHARPALAAQWWPDRPQILAGRDLVAGGTWLGITRSGRFAALTNYRDPHYRRADAPSRGDWVTSILDSASSTREILVRLAEEGAAYNGFNVIFSDGCSLGIYESALGAGRELAAGVYGLSNHLLDTPWPKVQHAKSRLETALMQPMHAAGSMPTIDTGSVLALLRDESPAADDELPTTGVSLEWERLLSSAFVRAPDYGTRCSSIICIDSQGHACFDEWTWDRDGSQSGRVSLQFEQA